MTAAVIASSQGDRQTESELLAILAAVTPRPTPPQPDHGALWASANESGAEG
jgi:hypothetical protein